MHKIRQLGSIFRQNKPEMALIRKFREMSFPELSQIVRQFPEPLLEAAGERTGILVAYLGSQRSDGERGALFE